MLKLWKIGIRDNKPNRIFGNFTKKLPTKFYGLKGKNTIKVNLEINSRGAEKMLFSCCAVRLLVGGDDEKINYWLHPLYWAMSTVRDKPKIVSCNILWGVFLNHTKPKTHSFGFINVHRFCRWEENDTESGLYRLC